MGDSERQCGTGETRETWGAGREKSGRPTETVRDWGRLERQRRPGEQAEKGVGD